MSLKVKLGLLMTAFGVFVVVSALLSFFSILVYLQSAAGRFHDAVDAARRVERVRAILEHRATAFTQLPLVPAQRQTLESHRRQMEGLLNSLVSALQRPGGEARAVVSVPAGPSDGPAPTDIERLHRALVAAEDRAVALADQGQLDEARRVVGQEITDGLRPEFQRALIRIARTFEQQTAAAVDQAYRTQKRVASILIADVIVAAALGVLGLILVERHVIAPVVAVQKATEAIAGGALDYRVPIRGSDELGQLSRRVNEMAAALAEARARLVQRERMAAFGEMVRAIAHNIRNPLAGVRAAAQETLHELPDASPPAENQQRILGTIDSFDKWFRGLLHASQPIELNRRPEDLVELIEQVIRVFQPSARQRDVRVDLNAHAPQIVVPVDPRRLEQALAAVIDNAIDASPAGGRVRVSVAPADGGPEAGGPTESGAEATAGRPKEKELEATVTAADKIAILIEDEGPGVAPELRERVFLPQFSSKADGTGIGLPLAKRIIEAHDGRVAFVDSDRGATLRIELPTRTDPHDGQRTDR